MTSTVLDVSTPAPVAPASSLARRLALEATVPAVLFASAAIVVGLIWDISWHRTIGRDTFWSPPHLLEQVAAVVAGLLCGWRVLYTTFAGTEADRAAGVRWWGLFRAPLGVWVCIWGTIAMVASAPFDDWWHNAYGLDVEILTPPHTLLLLGMVTVQLGAMLVMLGEQNRTGQASRTQGLLFAMSMGFIVLMLATMLYSQTGVPNLHRSPLFYQAFAAAMPLVLVAVARSARVAFPATLAAATYSAVVLVMSWTLALFPATPMLAPIYNPVTHMVPPGFPVLLVVPALAIDLLMRRAGDGRDWLLAVALGPLFVMTLMAVQWPFSGFLLSLEQPNYLFATGYWDYNTRVGEWTTRFIGVPGQRWQRGVGHVGAVDYAGVARAMLIASGIGMVSSRIGLWWGSWMRQVQR
jgi:hypothetical protein